MFLKIKQSALCLPHSTTSFLRNLLLFEKMKRGPSHTQNVYQGKLNKSIWDCDTVHPRISRENPTIIMQIKTFSKKAFLFAILETLWSLTMLYLPQKLVTSGHNPCLDTTQEEDCLTNNNNIEWLHLNHPKLLCTQQDQKIAERSILLRGLL